MTELLKGGIQTEPNTAADTFHPHRPTEYTFGDLALSISVDQCLRFQISKSSEI